MKPGPADPVPHLHGTEAGQLCGCRDSTQEPRNGPRGAQSHLRCWQQATLCPCISQPRAHKPCRNEQSQLLLLHWAERRSSHRATKLPLVSLHLEGAGSKEKITTSLTLIKLPWFISLCPETGGQAPHCQQSNRALQRIIQSVYVRLL